MPSFVTPANGDDALAEHVAQLTENLSGLRNIPIQLSGINDASNYALTVKNVGTGSKDTIMYAADGTTVLLQVDATGVRASASGGAAAPILTTAAGSIATANLADQSVTNAKLASDTARANLLTNGGFEIWQRGAGPFTVTSTYTADRWFLVKAGTDTLTISQETSIVAVGSAASAKCVFVLGSGAGATNIEQYLATTDTTGLVGDVPVSISARVRCSTASAVRLQLDNFYAGASHYTNSAYHTGDGTWQTLTATTTLNSAATYVGLCLHFYASCTAYLDNAMLVIGSVAADYAPLHPADDLARCQRYYEVFGEGGTSALSLAGYQTASGSAFIPLIFRVKKPVTPTMTKNGTWAVTNCSQPAVAAPDTGLAQFATTVTATGSYIIYNTGATCFITAESNP